MSPMAVHEHFLWCRVASAENSIMMLTAEKFMFNALKPEIAENIFMDDIVLLPDCGIWSVLALEIPQSCSKSLV